MYTLVSLRLLESKVKAHDLTGAPRGSRQLTTTVPANNGCLETDLKEYMRSLVLSLHVPRHSEVGSTDRDGQREETAGQKEAVKARQRPHNARTNTHTHTDRL